MMRLGNIDWTALQLPVAAVACIALLYVYLRIRREVRQKAWQRKLAEETRLRKL